MAQPSRGHRLQPQALSGPDRVALIAFRGEGAELLLALTRSLVRGDERRSLSGLPGGGGTPLAAGIEAAGRPQAMQYALAGAAQLRAAGQRSVLIDSSPRPQPQAMVLAQVMAARYVPLPQGQARDVHEAVVGRR